MKDKFSLFNAIELGILLFSLGLALFFFFHNPFNQKSQPGKVVDSYKNVPVYYNGLNYLTSHGENFSPDGYYYGLKWQCVEFVKRFYYIDKHFKMPDGFGNAKDFFDPSVPQGGLNKERGLIQYRNGGNVEPKPDDILVFTNSTYGHVAIVTEVTDNSIKIIQQNEGATRQTLKLVKWNNCFYVGTNIKPKCWLRKVSLK